MRLLIASHKLTWAQPGSPSDYATDGGFSAQIGGLSELFDQTVLCVPVSAAPAPSGLTAIPERVVVHALPAAEGPIWRRRLLAFSWCARLWREVRSVDAVHAPVPGDVGFLAVVVALVARKPLFVRHCATWREPRTRADRLLRRLLERVAGGRVVVLATGADEQAPSPGHPAISWIFSSSIRASDLDAVRAGTPRSAPVRGAAHLVTGGRLITDKGADTAIAAFAELHRRGLAARLHVVGDGPARQRLEQQAEQLGVAEAVTFHGRLSRTEVLTILDRGDLFVYPTRSAEGFPKLVLEALSRGLPVVATAVSAIPSMIEGAGVVVEADPGAVAAAVEGVVGDPDRYLALQRQTLVNASRYTLEAWTEAIGARLTAAWGPLRTVRVTETVAR